ncbi:endothelin-converting enzyme 1 [Dermacentor silvarum]|uniref:endothelin-converting enzyme 1 n=1 Tax=Dermacentor silvarum TaxID=543639 RepID=UPI0021007223|nr:endothelin-converting enzyme 1 [Dermacentor silvarum]
MAAGYETFARPQSRTYLREHAQAGLPLDSGNFVACNASGDCFIDAAKPRSWRQYAVFVSAVALSTLALTFAVPQLVRRLAMGCAYPDCQDPGADIARSLKEVRVDPCQDFYGYVCTGWLQENPDAENHFERCAQGAFNEQDHLDELRQFMARFDLAWPASKPRTKQKVLDLLVAFSLDWGLPILFQLTVDAHFRRPGFRALHLGSSPYVTEWVVVRDTLQVQGTLLAYFDKASVLLSGVTADSGTVQDILAVDNRVLSAMVTSTFEIHMDTEMRYTLLSQLDEVTGPELTTSEFLEAVNAHLPDPLAPSSEMFVMNWQLLMLLGQLMGQASRDVVPLLAYITWHVIRALAPMTSHQLVRAQLGGSRMAATIYMLGRCYADADAVLPYAFAHVFARRWLPRDAVSDVAAMEESIRREANATMNSLSWMDGTTKAVALEKLSTLGAIVGRPQNLASDQALQLLYPYLTAMGSAGSYLTLMNSVRTAQLRHAKRFLSANGSMEGDVSVPLTVVNAFYLPVYHVMVIPAAILHPPFYVAGYPHSYNLGSLGHVLGHEMTHAFDPDTGLYDRSGQRKDWWTAGSRVQFENRLDCLRQMYNTMSWAEGIAHGDYALTENFADSGGLLKAYRAFRAVKAGSSPAAPPSLAGFTDEQLFFLSSCFKWCSTEDKQGAGSYSPPRLRCNVPLMNMREFAQAFDCGSGKTMNPASRCDFM